MSKVDTHRRLAGDDLHRRGDAGLPEDEQNRPFAYDKGVYRGQHDQTLDDQRVEALRQRTAGQKF